MKGRAEEHTNGGTGRQRDGRTGGGSERREDKRTDRGTQEQRPVKCVSMAVRHWRNNALVAVIGQALLNVCQMANNGRTL